MLRRNKKDNPVPEAPARRAYTSAAEEFILEQVSEAVIQVTHREQTGHFGLLKEWKPATPYGWNPSGRWRNKQGIEASWGFYASPDQALEDLTRELVKKQREADARKVNPGERRAAARQVLRELMEELPLLEN